MSTEHDFRPESTQHDWLEADLQSINRTVTPWVIFCGHRPMYINSNWSTGVSSDTAVAGLMRQSLEPLFFKYKVNLGVYGMFICMRVIYLWYYNYRYLCTI